MHRIDLATKFAATSSADAMHYTAQPAFGTRMSNSADYQLKYIKPISRSLLATVKFDGSFRDEFNTGAPTSFYKLVRDLPRTPKTHLFFYTLCNIRGDGP